MLKAYYGCCEPGLWLDLCTCLQGTVPYPRVLSQSDGAVK